MTDKASPPLRLYLIRHGETAWSLTGQHTGRTDIALTPRGERDAIQLAAPLGTAKFTHVFCSPLQRARKTCELAGYATAAVLEPDLTEMDYGEYEGQRTRDICKSRPDWNLFRDGCPGGETPDQIATRADRLIARLRRLEGNVALFSHGHFGRILAACWIGSSAQTAQHFLLSTASISILGYEHNSAEEPVIILWNSVADQFPHSMSKQMIGDR